MNELSLCERVLLKKSGEIVELAEVGRRLVERCCLEGYVVERCIIRYLSEFSVGIKPLRCVSIVRELELSRVNRIIK